MVSTALAVSPDKSNTGTFSMMMMLDDDDDEEEEEEEDIERTRESAKHKKRKREFWEVQDEEGSGFGGILPHIHRLLIGTIQCNAIQYNTILYNSNASIFFEQDAKKKLHYSSI
eukprot:scaffold20204_cov122-Amphora_coffeaeformis.AAC.4